MSGVYKSQSRFAGRPFAPVRALREEQPIAINPADAPKPSPVADSSTAASGGSPDDREPGDDALAAAASDGDHGAFRDLFERHKSRVARISGRFFYRPERVEEIVQEVFTKVYLALRTYSPAQGASFSAWLTRITVNSCHDQLRRERRRPRATVELREDEVIQLRTYVNAATASAEAEVISRDLASKLLARIRADDRLVLTLLDGEEMPVTEIAAILGWSASKVTVRAHRARAALRRIVGDFI
jgi:RNA polymerase sigma-70 factor (ECF subfamily)